MIAPNGSAAALAGACGAGDAAKQNVHPNTSAAQRARLLEALRKGPITTLRARRDLDILGVAPRIFELRHREGHDIALIWTEEATECGRLHRVARYVLMAEAEGSGHE